MFSWAARFTQIAEEAQVNWNAEPVDIGMLGGVFIYECSRGFWDQMDPEISVMVPEIRAARTKTLSQPNHWLL